MKTRLLILLNAIIFIGIALTSVFQKEKMLNSSESVILALAPVDPRSLIQGDYMNIRYAITTKVSNSKNISDGYIFAKKDDKGIHQFSRFTDLEGREGEGEKKIRFRKRNFRVNIGAESFFFQEGDGEYFEKAKFGLLKVSESGDVLLVGLLDEKLKLIRPERKASK